MMVKMFVMLMMMVVVVVVVMVVMVMIMMMMMMMMMIFLVTRGRSIHQRLAQFSTTMEAIHAKSEPLEIDEDEVPWVVRFEL